VKLPEKPVRKFSLRPTGEILSSAVDALTLALLVWELSDKLRAVTLDDGSVVHVEEKVVILPDGSKVDIDNETVIQADGIIQHPGGVLEHPDGRWEYTELNLIRHPDGIWEYEDGTLTNDEGDIIGMRQE
jgi:hypothetical protein